MNTSLSASLKTFEQQDLKMSKRGFLGLGCAGALAAMFGPRLAHAQAGYPSRPVSVIVPYAPGGQGDVFARFLSEPLAAKLKQAVVVENRPGASGMLGTRLIIRDKGDGYQLLLGQTGEIAINPTVNKNAGYDTLKDLAPIVLAGDSPLVLIAPRNAPYDTIQELIGLADKSPESVSYASSGTATPGHLAAAALALGTKTKMIHVPYKGAGQALTDVIGGQVNCFFSSASAAMGHIKSGSVKALAVSSLERLNSLPDVPTIAETVLPGFNFSLWGGYFAPKRTPKAIIERLNTEINDILERPEVRARFEADGAAVARNTPEQFTEFVKAEIAKYRDLIAAADISLE
ncbi:MAG: Bug family tripartite tricarboxylate transporter substrate binding protein [Pollutimonas bauzanensis]